MYYLFIYSSLFLTDKNHIKRRLKYTYYILCGKPILCQLVA